MSVYQEAYKLPEFKYEYERLKVEVRGPIHVVSFDDAANLNAMSYQQMADFNDYLKKVRMDPECRVIVLTGEGKSFCAGFNLNELNYEPPADMGRAQRDHCIMQTICSTGIRVSELRWITAQAVAANLVEVSAKGKRRRIFLPPKLREAWLYGSWDVYEGQFFEDFRDVPEHYRDRRWTHVIEPFVPDKGWTVCRSYDFGYGKPFSCAWWAVDYDGVLYRILELYGCTRTPNEGVKWTPDRQFAEIRRIETEHPWLKGREITGVADPAIWDASRGESVAQTAARYGVYFSPGDNERIAGWMQCHYRLQFDENGYPRMYVFRNCRAFIRTVPLMLYSQTRPEDLDTALEDHVCDEWRYFCMSRPVRPIRGGQTAAIWSDPLDQLR